jgi:cardiolipin synthase A/B
MRHWGTSTRFHSEAGRGRLTFFPVSGFRTFCVRFHTNLNIASWVGNCELDAVIENDDFARQMEAQYLRDLTNATEVTLDLRRKVRAPGEPRHRVPITTSGGGSGGRAAAGAIRIGNAVGAAFTDRRVFHPQEGRFVVAAGLVLLGLAVLFAWFPKLAAYPLVAVLGWISLALLYRSDKLRRERKSKRS